MNSVSDLSVLSFIKNVCDFLETKVCPSCGGRRNEKTTLAKKRGQIVKEDLFLCGACYGTGMRCLIAPRVTIEHKPEEFHEYFFLSWIVVGTFYDPVTSVAVDKFLDRNLFWYERKIGSHHNCYFKNETQAQLYLSLVKNVQ